MTADDREARILAALADTREEMLAFVAEAVRVPSVTGEEGAVAPLFERWFADHGFAVEVKTVDPAFRDTFPALAGEVDLEQRPNVFGRWEAGSGAPIVLNGHLDVVPPGDASLWRHDPFSGAREEGRIWGRGSADMKGGLAAAMYAMLALREAGVELGRDVEVQCVMAEERGGLGTRSALATQARPAAAIVLEPTDCVVAPACGGAVPFTLSVPGQAAHVCVPWTGVSAFDNLITAYQALRALERERDARFTHPAFDGLPSKAPLAAGRVVAGEWHASLPEHATLDGRIGVMPGETVDEVRAELRATIAALAERDPSFADHPAEIDWDNEGFAAWETPAEHPLVAALHGALGERAGESRLGAMTYGCDAGHFAAAGVPVVLFGPGRIENAHLPDEHVEEDQLQLAAEVLALGLARSAGGLEG